MVPHMVRKYVPHLIVFVLGIGVGSVVFGQRETTESQATLRDLTIESLETTPDAVEPMESPATQQSAQEDAAEVSGNVESIDVELGPGNPAEQRMLAMEVRWSGMSDQLDQLSRRVIDLEMQLARQTAAAANDLDDSTPEALPIDTAEDRQSALVFVGVDRRTAADIVSRESDLAMQRLDLRDRAAREGWLGSERFRDEMNELDELALDLRSEVGDSAFDRYLYETGQPNRVAITSILAGSEAELAGVIPGDIIENYAGEPVFTFTDLREATTSGIRNESVPVTIRRGDRLIETWMARGPIGVTLQADSASPN